MTWLPSSLRCRQTEMKPGWVAMKRARSAIRSSTSDWLFGGTLTVVIWVTMSVFSRISGMCVLPIVHRDNARDGAKFRLATRSASDSLGLQPALLDRLRDCDRAARHVGMQALDHAAVELHDALVLVLRQIECRDDLLCLGNVFRARRERGVARPDLTRMDQGLAVEAHVPRLAALAREALRVAEVVVDAVKDVEAEGARRRQAAHQPRQHRPAAGRDFRTRVLGEIVGSHHESRET